MPALLSRLLLVLGAAGLALLVFEGGHSLSTGRPWLGGNRFLGAPPGRLHLTDAERAAAAVHGGGPFALASDPGVAFVLKPGTSQAFDAAASVDRFGTRARSGGEPALGAKRIVLLGDSVTFGFGLRDEETMAARLERYLGVVTPAGTPAPAVFTLACPGWNVWNCGRALCDHIGRLQPDVVVYTPVANDLYDSFATTESGHRSFDFDPVVGALRPHVSYEAHVALLAAQAPLLSAADALALRAAGGWDAIPPVSYSGVTPESRRRWRGFAAVVADLDQRMRRRSGRLAVQLCFDETFERLVAATLGELAPSVPLVRPFTGASADDRLAGDAHPNARCADARARVLAEFLLGEGMLGAGAPAALPPIDPAYRDRVADRWPAEGLAAWRREREAAWRARIGPVIDLTRARGPHQVYGGVEADGMVGRGAWLALDVRSTADPGSRGLVLELELERLPAGSGLYPCAVAVAFGARPPHLLDLAEPDAAGGATRTLTVPAPGPDDLAADETATGCLDIMLTPTNYVLEEHEGRSRLASFRLRRAELRPAPH